MTYVDTDIRVVFACMKQVLIVRGYDPDEARECVLTITTKKPDREAAAVMEEVAAVIATLHSLDIIKSATQPGSPAEPPEKPRPDQ